MQGRAPEPTAARSTTVRRAAKAKTQGLIGHDGRMGHDDTVRRT